MRDETLSAFREAIRADYAAAVVRITKEFENWRRDEKALFEEFLFRHSGPRAEGRTRPVMMAATIPTPR